MFKSWATPKAAFASRRACAIAGRSDRSSRTVFLVNPASDNGATGRRWPELAHRAATLGLEGDTFFSERPGHLTELARGRSVAQVRALAPAQVIATLGGLPERKQGCALMAVGALRAALVDMETRR